MLMNRKKRRRRRNKKTVNNYQEQGAGDNKYDKNETRGQDILLLIMLVVISLPVKTQTERRSASVVFFLQQHECVGKRVSRLHWIIVIR